MERNMSGNSDVSRLCDLTIRKIKNTCMGKC